MKKFNLIGAPYQILLGKKSSADLVEFIETGKDSQNLSLEQIVKLLTEQKRKNLISTLEKEIAFRYLKTRKKDGFLNIISIFHLLVSV